MRKKSNNTKVTVKLRKAENEELWYLYLECYPVYEGSSEIPQRKRIYLNRSITTPKWDKHKPTRSEQSYQPLRDVNGVILCKSEVDRISCVFADEMRKQQQMEFDNKAIYNDDQEIEFAEMANQPFLPYYERIRKERHKNSSESIIINWRRVGELLEIFAQGQTILFRDINREFIERFRAFILSAPQGGGKSGTLSQNSASTYFGIFLASLKQAFVDGYFISDIASKTKGISTVENKKEYLTQEELNKLAKTKCDNPILKRAALFSALTGLRHCDIQKLKWKEIVNVDGKRQLHFTQQKTKGVEYMPIGDDAFKLCGTPQEGEKLVFEDLTDAAWINNPLQKWIKEAGITKKITFHCFRHTYATLQLANGTDIYTVSRMLGHRSVKTTQVYAKVVDELKEKAANNIKITDLDIKDLQ